MRKGIPTSFFIMISSTASEEQASRRLLFEIYVFVIVNR